MVWKVSIIEDIYWYVFHRKFSVLSFKIFLSPFKMLKCENP